MLHVACNTPFSLISKNLCNLIVVALDLGGQDPQEILHVTGDEGAFGYKEMGLDPVVGMEDPEGDQGSGTGKGPVAFLDHVIHEGRGKGSGQAFLAEFELGAVIADGNDLLGIDILVVEKGGIQVLDRAFLPVSHQGQGRKLPEIQEIPRMEIPPGARPPVMLFEELVGGGEDQDFLSHWDMGQEGIRRIIHAQQHIQFLVQHQLDQFLRILEGSDDIHFGIHPMELGQDVGKQDMGPGGIEAQMDLPDLAFFDFLDLQGQVLFQVGDPQQGLPQSNARFRDGQPGGAFKQPGPQLRFQMLDMFAEALLGHMGPFGSPGEVHFFHCQQEHLL